MLKEKSRTPPQRSSFQILAQYFQVNIGSTIIGSKFLSMTSKTQMRRVGNQGRGRLNVLKAKQTPLIRWLSSLFPWCFHCLLNAQIAVLPSSNLRS